MRQRGICRSEILRTIRMMPTFWTISSSISNIVIKRRDENISMVFCCRQTVIRCRQTVDRCMPLTLQHLNSTIQNIQTPQIENLSSYCWIFLYLRCCCVVFAMLIFKLVSLKSQLQSDSKFICHYLFAVIFLFQRIQSLLARAKKVNI